MIRFPSSLALSVVLVVACLACDEPRHSAAANVPDTDVRRLPPERKAVVPDVMLLAADRGRVLGADSAQVSIIVVSDLACEACQGWFRNVWPAVKAAFVDSGVARVTFVHYPLRRNQHAVAAASISLCASAQGQFWPVVARLFEAQRAWSAAAARPPLLDSLAAAPGVDSRQLAECTTSNRMLRRIRADIDWADSAQVDTLPAVMVGNRWVPTSMAGIRAAIDTVLRATKPVSLVDPVDRGRGHSPFAAQLVPFPNTAGPG